MSVTLDRAGAVARIRAASEILHNAAEILVRGADYRAVALIVDSAMEKVADARGWLCR